MESSPKKDQSPYLWNWEFDSTIVVIYNIIKGIFWPQVQQTLYFLDNVLKASSSPVFTLQKLPDQADWLWSPKDKVISDFYNVPQNRSTDCVGCTLPAPFNSVNQDAYKSESPHTKLIPLNVFFPQGMLINVGRGFCGTYLGDVICSGKIWGGGISHPSK